MVLVAMDNTTVVSYINRQGGMKSGSLCPPVEASVLVPSQGHSLMGQTHSRPLECDSRQTFRAQSSDSNRVLSLSKGIQSVVFQVGSNTSGLVRDPVQSQTAQFCVTGA